MKSEKRKVKSVKCEVENEKRRMKYEGVKWKVESESEKWTM